MRYMRQHTRLRVQAAMWKTAHLLNFRMIRARRFCPSHSRNLHPPRGVPVTLGSRTTDPGRRYVDAERRSCCSLPRLHSARRQDRLSPIDHRIGSRRPPPGRGRTRRRRHQFHQRRHAPQPAHCAFLQCRADLWECAEAGEPSSTPRPIHFSSPAGCCCRPAKAVIASSAAP